ncbi:YfiT family bacillithiol transferase [Roseivirga sp. BDSF3-8]|uniref:YfiT family bacillithiol transferase n=1 Tax=Roseivirga sp. BDSF3-8 TaxID=3241598 RepID=UPI0035323631
MNTDISLSYPVGKFNAPARITPDQLEGWINEIASFPGELAALTKDLGHPQVNWRYRPGGWTIKQVVHHCADSHMNSLMRFKLALTEDTPAIRPYLEDRWAELPDSLGDDLSHSLMILSGLHARWALLLRSLTSDQLGRRFVHPEHNREFTLRETIGTYAWHGRHHLAHIKQALKAAGAYN